MSACSTESVRTGDRGNITIFVAVMAVGFLAAAGLALDGGRRLGAISEARNIAGNAARACAQAIDESATRQNGVSTLDPVEGAARGQDFITLGNASGSASVDPGNTSCTATVTVTVKTTFLPGPYTASQKQSADAIEG